MSVVRTNRVRAHSLVKGTGLTYFSALICAAYTIAHLRARVASRRAAIRVSACDVCVAFRAVVIVVHSRQVAAHDGRAVQKVLEPTSGGARGDRCQSSVVVASRSPSHWRDEGQVEHSLFLVCPPQLHPREEDALEEDEE